MKTKETCRFCIKGNEKCEQRDKETEKRFPDETYGIMIPTDEYDEMGKELNEQHKCFRPVSTGLNAPA